MAKLPFAVVGDGTTGGGKVIGGSPGSTIEGKPIARVGDMATCPINGHGGTSPIVTGDGTCLIDGRPAARHNDSLACGCKLVASQGNVTTGDAGGNKSSKTNSKSSSASDRKNSSATSVPQTSGEFNEHFVVLDKSTGKPFPGFKYVIEHRGEHIEGELCELGKTDLVYSDEPEPVTLKYLIQTQIGVRE